MTDKLQSILGGNKPIFFLLAGPNGAGKSTLRKAYLEPLGFPCIDPDLVAREILGRDPATLSEAKAATIEATRRARSHFNTGISSGLETVFSDTGGLKLQLLQEAQALGFRVGVIFVGLENPMLGMARVQDRVEDGGHDVPDSLIEDRFPRCFENLKRALAISDFAVFVDNSGESRHRVFGGFTRDNGITLWDEPPSWYLRYGIGQ